MALTAPKWKKNTRLQHASNNAPAMRPGEHDHAAVKLLQEALIANGFGAFPAGATGNYGGETALAVHQVEERYNLSVDRGVAGREVFGVLDQLLQGKDPAIHPLPPGGTAASGAALARTDIPLAIRKVNKAITAVGEAQITMISQALAGPGEGRREFDKVTVDALRVHFRLAVIGTAAAPTREMDLGDLDIIRKNFLAVVGYLRRNATTFVDGTPTNGIQFPAETAVGVGPTTFGPAYRNFDGTDGFQRFGPNSRAAIVTHEAIHGVDNQAVKAVDVPEFTAAYATQAANASLHNPCSYASFAAHIFKGSDPSPRFGADRVGRFE